MEIIHGTKRERLKTNDTKRERKSGKIPGVLYGKGIQSFMFELGGIELEKEIMKNGEHGILNLEINGENHVTLIKEIQREAVNHKIIHIDLEELCENKKVMAEIPIIYSGEGSVRGNGGIVQKERSSVKVQCVGQNIPRAFNVDLSSLKAGDTYRICNLEMSSEISFIEDENTVLVSVVGGNKNNVGPELKGESIS